MRKTNSNKLRRNWADIPRLRRRIDLLENSSTGSSSTLAPFILNVLPPLVATNANTNVTITGDNFDPDTVFDLGSNITINNVIRSTPTSVVLDITVGNIEQLNTISATNNSTAGWGNNIVLESKNITVLMPGLNGVIWQGVTPSITTNIGSITKLPNKPGWSYSGVFGSVPANTDFSFSCNFRGLNHSMIGVNSNPFVNSSYNTIDYAFYSSSSGNLQIYENGAFRAQTNFWSINDKYEIKRIGGVVTYYKNNTLIYTSSINSNAEMWFDCSLYETATYDNLQFIY